MSDWTRPVGGSSKEDDRLDVINQFPDGETRVSHVVFYRSIYNDFYIFFQLIVPSFFFLS